jgi:ferredoxin
MQTTIYWFSGTGNSLAVAKDLALELGHAQLSAIPQAIREPLPAADRVGLVFPVYAFGMPRILREFARSMPVREGAYHFAVATMGGWAGGPHRQLQDILRGRGTDLAAGWSVVMPGNYTPLYGAPPEQKQQRMFLEARERVKQIADEVRKGVMGHYEDSIQPFAWLGGAMNRRAVEQFRTTGKKFHVDPTCTHCGVCARVCPAGNILMKEGVPSWLDKCEQCMACLQWCPVEAIQFGGATAGRRRYRHPNFKADDFFLRQGE